MTTECKKIFEFDNISADIRLPLKPGSIFNYYFSEVGGIIAGGANL